MAGEFDLDEQLRQAGQFDPGEMTAKLRERFESEGRTPADPEEVARRRIEKERAQEAEEEDVSETLYEQQRAERNAQGEESESTDGPGEHGGAASSSSAGAGAGSSVAFEPEEEVRSEPAADEESESEEADEEPEAESELEQTEEPEADSDTEPEEAGEETEPEPRPAAPRPAAADAEPAGESLSYDASVKFFHRDQYDKAADTRTQLKLPTELVDAMRTALARQAGEDFAKSITNVSLVSAFCAAKLGAELDTDANTEAGLNAFRRTDPQMGELTDQVATLVSEVSFAQDESVRARKAAKAATERIESLELAVSYWLAERLLGVSSGSTPKDVTESNIEKVESLRSQFRGLYDKRKQIDDYKSGRRAS